MTIKKKLFISNILMLFIPAILSIIAAIIIILVFTGVIRINNNSLYYESELFWNVVEETDDEIYSSWLNNSDLALIKSDIDNFNSKKGSKNIFLSLYENGKLIYPNNSIISGKTDKLVAITSNDAQTHTVIIDDYAFYSKKINNYTAVLTCSSYMELTSNLIEYKSLIIKFIALLFIIVITIIFITNYFLTKYLLKSIVEPLDILSYSVHQIQLGELNYHIKYDNKDEFSTVCDDFNLMAQILRESVDSKKKDEMSRKELIAGISHDLRTPLTSIKAYVEGLLDGIANTPQIQKSYLETIKVKAEDINQIVDKLFLFSKLDIGEYPFYFEKIDIGEEVAAYINTASDEYKNKGLMLKLTKNIKNVIVNIDSVQFRSVLTNILENSVKYKVKEYGSIEIECFEQNEDVYVTLADDGHGVPEESLNKIFDMFYRNDQSRNNPSQGSGLGLAISAKIIERLDGQIFAENASNGGLKIVIALPKY